MTEILDVSLGARSYQIHIGAGLLAQSGALIRPILPRPFTVIVTDENVAKLHLENLQAGLQSAGIHSETIVLPAGEATKSMSALTETVERLLALKVERDDLILGLWRWRDRRSGRICGGHHPARSWLCAGSDIAAGPG